MANPLNSLKYFLYDYIEWSVVRNPNIDLTKALYGRTGGTYSARIFRPVMVVTVEFFFFVKFLMSSRPVYLFSCGKLVMRNFFHEFFFLPIIYKQYFV